MDMELDIDESTLIYSIRLRYVNMTKRLMQKISSFDEMTPFIKELHNIHAVEKKIVRSRLVQVNEVKDLADESHCHLPRFFKYQSTLGQFKRFWRDLNNEIFTAELKAGLAAAYAIDPRIIRIDVGYHAYRTGRENGKELLALLAGNHTETRITFADGEILTIPSIDEIDSWRDAFERKMQLKWDSMVLVSGLH